MRVKVFLFAAITAALALPLWARGQRFEKPPVDPDAEEVKGTSAPRQPAYSGYGFAPSLEPNVKAWKKQWRPNRRLQRQLAKQERKAWSHGAATGEPSAHIARRGASDALPPYWSFAEPGFSPPWLTEPIPPAVDVPRA